MREGRWVSMSSMPDLAFCQEVFEPWQRESEQQTEFLTVSLSWETNMKFGETEVAEILEA